MAAKLAGAKAGRYALRQNSDINVTPFVDVMLVLLIVMMVTAPMATVSIRMDIPPPGPGAAAEPPTFISVRDDGGLVISTPKGQRASSVATLGRDLGVTLPTDQRILIRADRHVSYGRFMAVVDALKDAGYQKIGLISEAA
ncbi:MAG TPA: biopolymer transporter ExbD [Caulobacteraceae bacterium]|nr:biopolymer transporter ExbD [Caulobacteraceae bacterium]